MPAARYFSKPTGDNATATADGGEAQAPSRDDDMLDNADVGDSSLEMNGQPEDAAFIPRQPELPADVSAEWQQAYDAIASTPLPEICVISSSQPVRDRFISYLAEKWLSTDALSSTSAMTYIDTDVSSPYFMHQPHGVVAAYKLSSTTHHSHHPIKPQPSYYYGSSTINTQPQHYDKLCAQLVQHCMQQPSTPLLVSTGTWLKGRGRMSIETILKSQAFTHVIQLCDTNDIIAPPVPATTTKQPTQLIHCSKHLEHSSVLNATAAAGRSSQHRRAVRLAQHWTLHSANSAQPSTLQNSHTALNMMRQQLFTQRPYVIQLACIKIIGCEHIAPAYLLHALRCCLVGMLNAEDELVGMGVIRAVSAAPDTLYVTTHLPMTELKHVTALKVGQLQLPPMLFPTSTPAQGVVSRLVDPPYFSFLPTRLVMTSGGQGTSKRRNVARKRLRQSE